MLRVLMTFDLKDAQSDDYERGYNELKAHGLSCFYDENNKTPLPRSSVCGTTSIGENAEEICTELRKKLEAASGKTVERMSVAVVKELACYPKESAMDLLRFATQFCSWAKQL